ncbi:AI-2E family transporter [Ahrensia sp. R2A130]|uniref:AI-2E family transporter n=1 Tax=Ahrensia sp. R2A130 TaxID=744979 RepID=UPI0001E09418|nr:AI-2E family transporter [Ahrensia sp. R2A130]EFL90569.1 ATP/GTP-binding protein [Ahrensia sp. R2A130]
MADEPLLTPSARRQLFFWLGAFVVTVLFLIVFRSILLPFIAGMALAYMLDPVADKLEKLGASRLLATTIILFVFIIMFALALILLVPVLSNQFSGLIQRMPSYVTSLQSLIASVEKPWLRDLVGESADNIRENLDGLLQQGAGWASTVLGSIWQSGKALVDVLSLLVITPIVAFYLLLDWDRMTAKVESWLPRQHKGELTGIADDMNAAIAGFVRGQGTVCLILGTFYALGLTLAGLNFGLLIGMIAGLISFIPFVGSIIGAILAIGVALVQFWPDYIWIGVIAGIFAVGQFFEGNFLQPKLVGESVGLHPVWLMFSLSAFGALMGFTGLLIAVPVAAAIGVLVRYTLGRYLQSQLYLGRGTRDDAGAE